MTTDSTQAELTKILSVAIEDNVRAGMRYGTKQEREKIPMYPFSIDEPVVELRAAILDWHNKQVEEVLDRLEKEINTGRTFTNDYVISEAIEAERNKLKESK